MESSSSHEIITFMEYDVYSAAEKGEIYPVFEERKDRLHSLLTPQKNTILHIYLTSKIYQKKNLASKTLKYPEPEITNEVPEPEITNEVPEPEITNEEPEPEITNEVPEPEITNEVPEPEITNEDPAPEITNEVPGPEITNEVPEPEIANEDPESKNDKFAKCLLDFCPALRMRFNTSKTNKDQFVEGILRLCPALLMQVNTKDETPFHFAARYGHTSIVQLLIEHAKKDHRAEAAKKMLRMASKEGDTALHEAVRFRHLHVVKILIREDGDFQHKANKSGETPLYMAVERGYDEIAKEIIDHCNSPGTGGPNDRNVLHIAAIRDDQVMIEKILTKLGEEMLKQPDRELFTPLHYAAHWGNFNAVKTFLKKGTGREAAYMKNRGGNTALHLASVSRSRKTMLEIIKQCPDSSEIVNNSGRNILHIAAQERFIKSVLKESSAMKEILQSRNSLSNLINEKDAEGKTPFHHVAVTNNEIALGDLIDNPRVDMWAFNNENKNVYDIAFGSPRDRLSKHLKKKGLRPGMRAPPSTDTKKDRNMEREFYEKIQSANVIVAALIATATFGAGFNVPGGLVSEKGQLKGTPILGRHSAFRAFLVMDTIAFVLSISSVLIHLLIRVSFFLQFVRRSVYFSFFFTIFATVAMVVGFAAGTYAILGYSAAFSIVICVFALSSLIIILCFAVGHLLNWNVRIFLFGKQRLVLHRPIV